MKMEGRGAPARIGSLIGLFLSALAFPGAALADRPASDELVISGSQWIADAPTRVAALAGYFDSDTGPPIRVDMADSGKQSLERLMAGDADFALMASVPLAMTIVRLHHKGAPFEDWPVVLASVGLSNQTHHLIADSRRGIQQPVDLAGQALGLPFDTSAHFGWDLFADFHGIARNSVRLVETRPHALAGGLAAGRLDAVVAWSPLSTQILDQLGGHARSFALRGMDSVSWLLVCRRSLIARHPEAVTRVLQGYAEAIDFLHTDPVGASALLDQSPDWLRETGIAWKLSLDWPVLSNMEAKLKWSARRLGVAPVSLSPHRYIERAPLQQFQPNAVNLPIWSDDGGVEQ